MLISSGALTCMRKFFEKSQFLDIAIHIEKQLILDFYDSL